MDGIRCDHGIDDILHVQAQRFDTYWQFVTLAEDPRLQYVDVDLAEGRAATFRILAGTPSGPVVSNEVELSGFRRRAVSR